VDDAVKIREKSGMVQLPNDSLRPEYLYSLEQTLTWNLGGGDALQVTGGAFYTFWEDAIITVNATLPDGDTTFVFQGDTLRAQTLANAARANIWGARAELGAQITPTIGLQGTMNWTYGKDWGSGEPLAHIPPTFGRVAMDYEYRWLTVVASVQYNLAKPIANYGPDGEDNEDEALPTGTPAWWTLNAELAMELSENWQMQVGVRNILDQHYQVFSSGIAAAGRGLYASLHAAF
jgi:hemoglobin/transferrin/lactoferrin receptor protein